MLWQRSQSKISQDESLFIVIISKRKEFTMKVELTHAPPTHFDFMIFWRGVPFFFKILVLFSYPLAIACMFCDSSFLKIFGNFPALTLRHGQFWRLLSAPYVSLGMLHYSIAMINLYYLLPVLQKTYSTAFIVIDFFVQSLLLQLSFTFVVSIVSDLTSCVFQTYSCSLLGLLVMYLVRVCHAQDKQMQVCCMPFKLRSRYYPILIMVFFNIFTLPVVQMDVLLAYVLGLIQVRFCGGTVVCASTGCLRVIENQLLGVFGRRADIYLLEFSQMGTYEETLKQTDFREKGSMMSSPHIKEIHMHSEIYTPSEPKFLDTEINNSV